MSSVLITSTMKSEPGVPLSRDGNGAAPVSAAATWAFGGSADGSLCCGSAAVAALAGRTGPLAAARGGFGGADGAAGAGGGGRGEEFSAVKLQACILFGHLVPLGIVWLSRPAH